MYVIECHNNNFSGQQSLGTRSEEQLPQQHSPANGVATPRRGWLSLLCNSYTMGMGIWVFIAPKPEGVNDMHLNVLNKATILCMDFII